MEDKYVYEIAYVNFKNQSLTTYRVYEEELNDKQVSNMLGDIIVQYKAQSAMVKRAYPYVEPEDTDAFNNHYNKF